MLTPAQQFHIVSKQAQGQKYVTISHTPYWLWKLHRACVRVEEESPRTSELKAALLASLERRCGYYLSTVNNALKAAALDPRFAALGHFGVPAAIVQETWDGLVDEALNETGMPGPNDPRYLGKRAIVLACVAAIRP